MYRRLLITAAQIDKAYAEKSKAERGGALHECGRTLLAGCINEMGIEKMPTVRKGDFGKPYFPEYPNLTFNISHSGFAAVCAFGVNVGEIGIDLEYIEREGFPSKFERIAPRLFSESEIDEIRGSDDSAAEFYRIWTEREAMAKYTGRGISEILEKRHGASKKAEESDGKIYSSVIKIGGLEYAMSLAVGEKVAESAKNIEIAGFTFIK